MAEIFAVPLRGVGKPDYTRIVEGAKERRGIHLDYGQTLMVFGITPSTIPSPYCGVRPPLAPGETAHAINVQTGIPMPFIVQKGYIFTVIAISTCMTEDVIGWAFIDTALIQCAGIAPGGQTYFENKLVGLSTALIDPLGAHEFIMDFTLTNIGLGNAVGTIDYVVILEAVGTPPLPLVKTVKCKWCGHQHEVPNETTSIICPNCGKLFIVYDLSKVRRTP